MIRAGTAGKAAICRARANFECSTTLHYEGGDHVIFIGAVVGFTDEPRPPLVYHSGGYGLAVKKKQPGNAREGESSFHKNFLGDLLGASDQQVFQPIRKELSALELSGDDYLILSILGIGDDRSRTNSIRCWPFQGAAPAPRCAPRFAGVDCFRNAPARTVQLV